MTARPQLWTHERLELLKEYWADGDSTRVIAERLGPEFTRNSVIGKAHRMQLESRKIEHAHVEPDQSAPVPAPVRPRPVHLRPLLRFERSPGGPLGVLDLTDKTCRWPIGDVGVEGFHFCGELSADESPYCPHHRHVAYQPLSRGRA